jgi:glycosyltransferase involved in cell wall biosynthesis
VGAATAATTAAPPSVIAPGQRIDVRVLLISADGTEPGFGAWKAEPTREGVPFDTLVAYTGATRTATLTDDRLADYADDHAKDSAVILSTGDPTDDPPSVMRAADVVLMTSISEGLPMVILEAMGQGRPVVATGVGGVPEVVRGCGVVCPPGDEHALAMAVVILLRNPALAWQLGRRGHQRLSRIFTEAACVDGYRTLLRTMAGAAA